MQGEIKISAIVPVYKVEKYLPDCIDSLLAQTFKELEIILIDDGSPDKSGEICDAYAKKDSRIKVVHKPNGGVGSARNTGIELAGGEYISFIDSDDFIHPLFYRTLYDNLLNFNADTSAICLQEVPENARPGLTGGIAASKPVKMTNLDALNCILDFSRPWLGYPVNKLYSLGIIRKNRLRFDESIKLNEDSLFNCQYFQLSKDVVLDGGKMYFYRIHSSSATRTATQSAKPLETKIFAYEKMMEIAKNYPHSIFQKRVCTHYYETCFSYLYALSRLRLSDAQKVKNIAAKIRNANGISFAELPLKLKIFRILLGLPAFAMIFILKGYAILRR